MGSSFDKFNFLRCQLLIGIGKDDFWDGCLFIKGHSLFGIFGVDNLQSFFAGLDWSLVEIWIGWGKIGTFLEGIFGVSVDFRLENWGVFTERLVDE